MEDLIAVTGANGFIGRELVKRLVQEGFSVRALQRKVGVIEQPAVECRVIGDIGDDFDFIHAVTGAKAVVHLAARVHRMSEDSLAYHAAYEKTNTEATLKLAQAAVQSKVQRFVYLSTVKVNGEFTNESPFSERDWPSPSEPYAKSKWKAEQGLIEISRESGLEVVILRPPLVYGPGVKGNFLLLMNLVKKVPILPLGGLSNKRSMVGLGNLTDMIVRCVTHPNAAGEVFFVSDGRDVSVTELIRLLAAGLKRRCILLPVPKEILDIVARLVGKQGAVSRLAESLQVDITKARQMLDWMPPNTIEAEIARTAGWYGQEM